MKEIVEILKKLENLDILECSQKYIHICKKFEDGLPCVLFNEKTNKYYFFEVVVDVQLENGELNLEGILHFDSLNGYKISFEYQGENYLATYLTFDLNTSKYVKDLSSQEKILLGRYLYQDGTFSFFDQRNKSLYNEEIFDGSVLNSLFLSYQKFLQENNYFSTDKEDKIKYIYTYIKKNFSYAKYMTGLGNQDTFEKTAFENTDAFFLPGILEKKECVCQSYSQLFLLLCFFEKIYTVMSIFNYTKSQFINHVRNLLYIDTIGGKKYYFVDITMNIFKEISKETYDVYKKEEFSGIQIYYED